MKRGALKYLTLCILYLNLQRVAERSEAKRSEANPCGAASFAKVQLGLCNSSFLIKAFLKALKHFAKIYRGTELCSIPQSVYIVLNKTIVISFISLLNT